MSSSGFIVTDICGQPCTRPMRRVGQERKVYVRVPAVQRAELQRRTTTTERQLAENPKLFHKRGLTGGWYDHTLPAGSAGGPSLSDVQRNAQLVRESGYTLQRLAEAVPRVVARSATAMEHRETDKAAGLNQAGSGGAYLLGVAPWSPGIGVLVPPVLPDAPSGGGGGGGCSSTGGGAAACGSSWLLKQRRLLRDQRQEQRYHSPMLSLDEAGEVIAVPTIFGGISAVSRAEIERRDAIRRHNVVETKAWRIGVEVPIEANAAHEAKVRQRETERVNKLFARSALAAPARDTTLLGESTVTTTATTSATVEAQRNTEMNATGSSTASAFVAPSGTNARRIAFGKSYPYLRQLNDRRQRDELNMIAALDRALSTVDVTSWSAIAGAKR